jgi:hypothetical protein
MSSEHRTRREALGVHARNAPQWEWKPGMFDLRGWVFTGHGGWIDTIGTARGWGHTVDAIPDLSHGGTRGLIIDRLREVNGEDSSGERVCCRQRKGGTNGWTIGVTWWFIAEGDTEEEALVAALYVVPVAGSRRIPRSTG